MEKIYIKIEKYLKDNFPGKKVVLSKYLSVKLLEKEGYDLWGIYSVPIIVKEVEDTVYYKPVFQK